MDIMLALTYLAAGAVAVATDKAAFGEDFVKWLALLLSGGYVPMFVFIKSLLDQRNDLLQKQIDEAPANAARNESIRRDIETEIRSRYSDIIKAKDVEITALDSDIREMRAEKYRMLEAQIEDAKKQDKGLRDLTNDYKSLVEDHIGVLIKRNVDVLEYYQRKREKNS